MKEFTITNIFKCWLKLWPITVILAIIGVGLGEWSVSQTKQEYSAKIDLLIVDQRDGSAAVNYAGFANSDLVSNPLFKKAAVDDGCKMTASGTGDIITFTATCPTSDAEAKKLAEMATTNFTEWAQDIYGSENFKTVQLSEEATITTEPITTKHKLIKVAVPVVAALAASLVIAFVYLDYKVSKGDGKKA